ncbi:MAG: hypothetical protein N3E46_12320 [Gemmataceae bacterium]|mgnify:CR=1 FL=1|jgi:hypothetical protein|uniref:Uncharacterized protein n=1 Tax=Thermogemmata fonticola TaxID=2755323 RepID=A0A7V9ABP4_9BACT|nr:hypothetical protein [Thermogemmata fonticola]MBA2225952.1 hypothetical protein [Thermogemmata fonticola]MCX8140456.1 hypothetical protein [Gemmataceae bacterium]
MNVRFCPVLTVLESRENPNDWGPPLPFPIPPELPSPLLPNGEPLDQHPEIPLDQPDDPWEPLDPIGP